MKADVRPQVAAHAQRVSDGFRYQVLGEAQGKVEGRGRLRQSGKLWMCQIATEEKDHGRCHPGDDIEDTQNGIEGRGVSE